jgi:hypothetical protein
VHRQSGIDHRVDEQHVAPRDLGVEVLEEADSLAVVGVAGELDEIEGMERPCRERQVRDEGDA